MPAWLLPAAIAAASAIGSAVSSKNSRDDRKSGEVLTREQIEQREREGLRDTASSEAALDPFRQQLQQAGALGRLDLMSRMRMTPTRVQAPERYAGSIPTRSGGLSYEMDPAVRQMAEALKRDVASGRTAPTMTNPANYGRTSTLDMRSLLAMSGAPGAAGVVPTGGGAPASPRFSFDEMDDPEIRDMFNRRRTARIA
jgi:hypothetical protein